MNRLESPATLRAIVLGAIALCLVASMQGAHAGAETNSLKFAIFDADKARAAYKYVATAQVDFQKKIEDTDTMLKAWQANPLLVEADQKKLSDLLIEEKRAGANFDQKKKDEIKKLQDMSKGLTEEFGRLQADRNSLTPAQKERLNILVRAASDTESRLQAAQVKAREDLQKIDGDVSAKTLADMRDTVNKVAKEKGYAVVFSAGMAWYADNDITQAVVDALNKK